MKVLWYVCGWMGTLIITHWIQGLLHRLVNSIVSMGNIYQTSY